jgi:multiple antibiotic resistance protein
METNKTKYFVRNIGKISYFTFNRYKPMIEIFIAVLAKIFSIVNPFGVVPMYLTMTTNYEKKARNRLILSTSLYFVGILLVFFWGGAFILGFFGLSVNALRIAGGLVILNSAFALQNDKFAENRGVDESIKQKAMESTDIAFSPLAMPMLSGPGSISLLIGFFAEYEKIEERLLITGVILLMGIIVSAPLLYRFLGESGLKAGSRIMAFITMAIGVQYIITGIVALVKSMT